MQGVPIRQKIISGEGQGLFYLPDFFGFILHSFCGAAAVPLCRAALFLFSYIQHTRYQKKKLSTLPGDVRAATARDAKRMWRPSCFSLKHGGGTLGIIKSPVCNHDHDKKLYSIMDLCPLRIVIRCTVPSGASVAGGVGRPRSEAPCGTYSSQAHKLWRHNIMLVSGTTTYENVRNV